jgi:prefoldin subunit 5
MPGQGANGCLRYARAVSGTRASPPDPLPDLERRLDRLERELEALQRSVVARLRRSLRVLVKNEDGEDARLTETLKGLDRQIAEIRARLDALTGPTTTLH